MSSSYWFFFFFFKQKTAYEMRISDWSSDVCSSDLPAAVAVVAAADRACDGAFAFGHEDLGVRAALPQRDIASGIVVPDRQAAALPERSEERRVGKECVSTCRSRWSPYH